MSFVGAIFSRNYRIFRSRSSPYSTRCKSVLVSSPKSLPRSFTCALKYLLPPSCSCYLPRDTRAARIRPSLSLNKNAVTSASIMVPCPWLTEVASYAKDHPDADLGLHLTLTSEWKTYRWGPLESRDKVPSLYDLSGYLWPETAPAATNEKSQEAEREIRAQIERAIALGIHPTHLDSHMGVLFSTPELLAVYVKVAHEYKLPFLAVRIPNAPAQLLSILSEKDVVLDSVVIANPAVHANEWRDFYVNAVKNLKPGLTEMIVHLGHDDAELQAVTLDHPDYGSAWRQRDYDVITSPEFKKALRENNAILVKWKDLKELVN